MNETFPHVHANFRNPGFHHIPCFLLAYCNRSYMYCRFDLLFGFGDMHRSACSGLLIPGPLLLVNSPYRIHVHMHVSPTVSTTIELEYESSTATPIIRIWIRYFNIQWSMISSNKLQCNVEKNFTSMLFPFFILRHVPTVSWPAWINASMWWHPGANFK